MNYPVAVGNNRVGSAGTTPGNEPSRSAQIIPFSLAAGQSMPLTQSGERWFVVSSTGAVTVQASLANATMTNAMDFKAGTGYKSASEFAYLTLTNNTGGAITGTIFVGFGKFLTKAAYTP